MDREAQGRWKVDKWGMWPRAAGSGGGRGQQSTWGLGGHRKDARSEGVGRGGSRRGALGLGWRLHPLSTWDGAGSWEAGSRAVAPCADLAGKAEKEVVESVWAVFGSGPLAPAWWVGGVACAAWLLVRPGPPGSPDTLGLRQGYLLGVPPGSHS